jgi:hypothetical protein
MLWWVVVQQNGGKEGAVVWKNGGKKVLRSIVAKMAGRQ